MTDSHPLKIARLDDASRIEFGPLVFHHLLVADGDTPVRTGIQTSSYESTRIQQRTEPPLESCAFLIRGHALPDRELPARS